MKRFTETGKWDDPWFGELPPMAKLLWVFLVDNCDHAGVWAVNRRIADFKIGAPITWDEAARWFGDRVRVIEGGAKWLLPKYTRFQNPGGLKPRDPFTVHVLRALEHHGLTLADIGMTSTETRPGVSPVCPVVAAPALGVPDALKSASAGSHEGATKGHGRGLVAPQCTRQSHDRVREMARSRSVLDGGSKGETAVKPQTAGEILQSALRKLGLDASPAAAQEWGDMLKNRGKCKDVHTMSAALTWIIEQAKRDGVVVKYAKHAPQLADAWAANHRARAVA